MEIWNYIFVLDIKEKHNFKLFAIIIHIAQIPTNKRANSYKLNISKLGNSLLTNQHRDGFMESLVSS